MRAIPYIFLNICFFLLLCLPFDGRGQNSDNGVSFGERPPVDLSRMKPENLSPGIIRVKFTRQLSEFLDKHPLDNAKDHHVIFGIPEMDVLNAKYHVIQSRQTFYIALQDTEFDQRHRQWGLHLWYDLIVPEGTDLIDMVREYSKLESVAHAEPVFNKQQIANVTDPGTGPHNPSNFTPNDPSFTLQWHYHNTGQSSGTPGCDIKLPEAWDITKGNSNVIVAVIDGGIDFSHADLAGNMWSGVGYNFVTNSPTLSVQSHGTHVAGTIAANTNNGIGVSGVAGGSGTGNGVRLMSCQVFTSSSSGGFESAPVWAADHGAAITQNSWGYTEPCSYEQPILDGIDYFVANGGGTVMTGGLVCFSAGNSQTTGLWYPGCYSKVIAVAATNNQDKKAWYSNYDNWVDIAAPGGETNTSTDRGVYSTYPGNAYAYLQGTSMACPHVSGAAALVVSLAAGHITAQDARDIILSSTDNISALNPLYPGMLGSGRLNAFAALQKTQAYLALFPPVSMTATTVNTSHIKLGWSSNPANDSVVLAFSTNGVFGNPTGNYQPGQSITGGGTILYKGKAGAFNHTGLNPAATYYYALWTKNGNNYSVVVRKANTTTSCNPVVVFPWTEGFENNGVIPVCWTEEQVSNSGVSWKFNKGDGYANPAAAYSGSYNALFSDASSTDNKTKLVTPCLNLLMVANTKVKFYHTQQVWGTDQDELRVFYKNSPTGSWNLLAAYTNSITAWQADSLTLPSPSSTYYLAFEGNAKYGYGSCLDNVSVYGQYSSKTLNVTALLECLYNGSGTMRSSKDETGFYYGSGIADKITVELHDTVDYATVVYSVPNVVLSTGGTATISIPGIYNGRYYLGVKHRNSIETVSSVPVSFAPGVISYNFTDLGSRAFGNNQKQAIDGVWTFFAGDVTQDYLVDGSDISATDNQSAVFAAGFLPEDANGDGLVDGSDLSVIDNNATMFVSVSFP